MVSISFPTRQGARSSLWQIRTTDKDLQSLYVSDASDSHVYIYKADGQFQYVREFELTAGERLASSGYRELLAVKKSLQEDPDQFRAHKGGTIFWQTDSKNCYGFLLRGSRQPDIQKVVMDIKCIVLGAHKLRARRTVCKSVFFSKDINC